MLLALVDAAEKKHTGCQTRWKKWECSVAGASAGAGAEFGA